MKSQVENAGEEKMEREGWKREGRLNSQIENAVDEGMGRGQWRVEGRIVIAD